MMNGTLVNFEDAFRPCDTHPGETRRYVSMQSLRCECQKCVFITGIPPATHIQLRRYMYNVVVNPRDVSCMFPGADASTVRPYTSNGHPVLHIHRRPPPNQAPTRRLEHDAQCRGPGCNYSVLDAKYSFCSIECLLAPTLPSPSPTPTPATSSEPPPPPSPPSPNAETRCIRLARRKVAPTRSYFE